MTERRRSRRQKLRVRGKLVPGNGLPMRDCTVLDISESGAKLGVGSAGDLPSDFAIMLSPRGYPYRRCRLVWRSAAQVGVSFYDPRPEITENE